MTQSSNFHFSQQDFRELMTKYGVSLYGWGKVKTPVSLAVYKDWLENGFNGDMAYLSRHLGVKEDPKVLLNEARSILSIAVPYLPNPKPHEKLTGLNIAEYARNEDYHDWLKELLEQIIMELKAVHPEHVFLAITDSAPLLERDFAYQAGMGWFGKNSCLINTKMGSYFLLGEILTSLDVAENSTLSHDMCGTCSRCIEACPTSAILNNKTIDSRLCISYWTIESKEIPSAEMRPFLGSHFFGCDICQEVCPWNGKLLNLYRQKSEGEEIKRMNLIKDLRFVLRSSEEELKLSLCNTPLLRSKAFGLKRNALIVAGNLQLSELKDEVNAILLQPVLNGKSLEELARWTLRHL